MAKRSLNRVFYSTIAPDEFELVRNRSYHVVSVRFPERKFWSQCVTGSELIIFSSTIPTSFIYTRVLRRGILSTPYYGSGRTTLIIYFTIEALGEVPTQDVLFRLSSGRLSPLNDMTLYSEVRAISNKYTTPLANEPARPDDLTPFHFEGGLEFRVSDGEDDARAIGALAEDHPFGLSQGHFEFVLAHGSNVVGAMQIISGESEHNSHHLQRLIFHELYPKIFRQSLTISRMFGPKDIHERRNIHRKLLKGFARICPYLAEEPLSIIDCISYDYVPALLDENFRFESSGRIYDAFYYWKPVFLGENDLPSPPPARRTMTAAYQEVKHKRDTRKHYGINVNHRYMYLASQLKMWCLRKMPRNNGIWRNLRKDDIVFFLRSKKFLHGYGVVEGAFSNKDPSLSDFPLGIRFREVVMTPEVDAALEIAEFIGLNKSGGGIFQANLEFASFALQAIRKLRGGERMWVVPNPFFVAETDVEVVNTEIFVVMPWEFRHSIYKTIREICSKEGYTATYAAETGGQVIMEDIWRLLNRARAVIIDFTNQRPNVYLEFGMAIVLGKPIIAITQNQDDCPSDVRNIKYVVYSADHAEHILEKELPKALRDTIEQVERMSAKRSALA